MYHFAFALPNNREIVELTPYPTHTMDDEEKGKQFYKWNHTDFA